MRSRLASLLLLPAAFFFAASQAWAQESPQETAILDAVTKWKIANFLIFLVLLAWFLKKYAPAFFNARSADIQRAIKDATGLKLEADYRYSEMDRKMATLAEAVAEMRREAAIEMEREHQRLREETRAEIAHIHHNVQAELEAFRNEGISHVRRHSANLALGLAERRLKERFTAGEPDQLMQDFVHLVDRGSTR